MLKKIIKINKPYNIINKLKGCLNCHKIKNNNNYKNLNIINIKRKIYKNLYNFKNLKKLNLIMNNIVINLKNKFILEISKYLKKIPKIKKFFLINDNFIWRW